MLTKSPRQATRWGEPQVQWRHAPRILPGNYPAISRTASIYFDKPFKRWVCAVHFDLFSDSSITENIARLTWFLSLGSRSKPRAGRRSNYWAAWIKANGALPKRDDRLSPRIFSRRLAIVRVEDTAKTHDGRNVEPQQAYSVIRDVIEWQTGGHAR
jgi:hypothetical protein